MIIPLYIYQNNNILVIIKGYNLKQIVVDMDTGDSVSSKAFLEAVETALIR
jgi:hypothetical protein